MNENGSVSDYPSDLEFREQEIDHYTDYSLDSGIESNDGYLTDFNDNASKDKDVPETPSCLGDVYDFFLDDHNRIAVGYHIEYYIINFFFFLFTMTEPRAPLSVTIDPLKYLNKLPEFNGDYRDLQTFINLIDRVHPILTAYDEPSQYLFSDIIKSRLRGKARETMEINCQAQSWADIKSVLLNNFGNKNSLEELFDKLKGVTFKTNCVEFYNDLKQCLRNLNNKTIIVIGNGQAANECAKNNMRTALGIFKEKMPEPMKTILICRNPDSLEDAMDILFQSGYAYAKISGRPFETRNHNNGKPYQYKKNTPFHDQDQNRGKHQSSYTQRNNYASINRPPHMHRSNNYDNPQHYRNNFRFPDTQYGPQKPQYQPPVEPMDVNLLQENNQTRVLNYRDHNPNMEQSVITGNDNKVGSLENFRYQASQGNYPI